MISTVGNDGKSVKVTQHLGNLTQFTWRKAVFASLILLHLWITVAVSAAETNFAVIKSFGNRDAALHGFRKGLIEGSDGFLYGVATKGRATVIVRLRKDGTEIETVHYVPEHMYEGVIEGSDGKLYGATTRSIFRLDKNGNGFEVLFKMDTPEDFYRTGVIEGRDGALYGRTTEGVVFRMERDGSNYRAMPNLIAWDGPELTDADDGHLYGANPGGNTIFRINKETGELRTVHSFSGGADGGTPWGRLVVTDGVVYGIALHSWLDAATWGGAIIYRVRTDGTSFAILKRSDHDIVADNLSEGLYEGRDGFLYGTTHQTLFRIRKNGTDFNVLHTFASTNGAIPSCFPIQASDGLLYGTTLGGGETTVYDRGDGVVYRLRPDGEDYQVLTFLDRTGGEGATPGKLIQGKDGILYGFTFSGGRSNTAGVVYQLNINGTGYSQLFTFSAVAVFGLRPVDLTEGRDGFLYATAATAPSYSTAGAVVRIPKLGGETTVIARFTASPLAIVQGADNRLYLCMREQRGGIAGTVVSMQTDGSDSRVVYSFPYVGIGYPKQLMDGSDGWLYGLTENYGSGYGLGSVFKMRPDGSGFVILRTLTKYLSSLIEGADGMLYGATGREGSSGGNIVFKIAKDGGSYAPFDLSIGALTLAEGADGVLYGVTTIGDLFRIRNDGRVRTIRRGLYGVSLIAGIDSAMYLTTVYGGDLDLGTLIRFIPPPDISLSRTSDVVRLTAEGLAGRQLRIETSPDFVAWTPVGPTSTSGRLSVEDTNTFGTKRFYRAVLEQERCYGHLKRSHHRAPLCVSAPLRFNSATSSPPSSGSPTR